VRGPFHAVPLTDAEHSPAEEARPQRRPPAAREPSLPLDAVEVGDAEKVAAEHAELVRCIDKAATRGALHRNTAARKKAQASRLASGKAA
jgi:hypothetical protein